MAVNVPFPEGKLVYDYIFEPAKMKWGAWLDRLDAKAVANSDADYSSIIVPTGKLLHGCGCCLLFPATAHLNANEGDHNVKCTSPAAWCSK